MRRRVVLVIAAVAGLLLGSVPASAQPTLGEVLADIDEYGYYVEPGVDADFDGLDAVFTDLGDELALVVLASDDAEAPDQVDEALNFGRAVLVITPNFVDARASGYSDSDVQRGIDAAVDALAQSDEDYGQAASAFQRGLTGSTAPVDAGDGGGGGAGILIFLVIVVAVIGLFVWLARRKGKQVDTGEVDRAKAEIRAQLDGVAREILEHESEVEIRGDDQAIAFFREANATYTEVSEAVDETDNLLELAELNDEIDEARWQLEAAEAIMDGRPVPPEPEPEKPVACFFDPTHKPGVKDCTIHTEAGSKEVRVCNECAAKLERGESPEPRMIDVGGRRVPAAKAPRSHGGLGMGGLSAFEVILGGLGAVLGSGGRRRSGGSLGFDWGGGRPQSPPRSRSRRSSGRRRQQGSGRPGGGGIFGPDPVPARPRGLPRSPSSRRPRTPRKRSGASGRGRARRRR